MSARCLPTACWVPQLRVGCDMVFVPILCSRAPLCDKTVSHQTRSWDDKHALRDTTRSWTPKNTALLESCGPLAHSAELTAYLRPTATRVAIDPPWSCDSDTGKFSEVGRVSSGHSYGWGVIVQPEPNAKPPPVEPRVRIRARATARAH